MKKIFISVICLLLLSGCGNVKLQNGEDAVVSFKKGKTEHKISAEELFEELKKNYGLEATSNMIDKYILEREFKDYIDTAKETAKSYIDSYIETYGGEDAFLEQIKQYTNYTTIEGYQDSLYISIMQNHALEEYAKTLVTDKEINNYYENDVKGNVEIYQILVIPKVKDNMTDEEKEKAETDAKNKIKEIVKKLDDSKDKLETFKSLVKEYSEDETSKKKDGNLGYINYGDLDENYDTLLDEAYKLKNNSYSKNAIGTELGYHLIYRTNIKEKESLDKLKTKIIEELSRQKMNNITTISVDSLKYWRELYNVKINDSELNRQYGLYLNALGNELNNSNN